MRQSFIASGIVLLLAIVVGVLILMTRDDSTRTDYVSPQDGDVVTSVVRTAPETTVTSSTTTPPTTSTETTTTTTVPVRTSDLFVAPDGIDREDGGWTAEDPLQTPSYAATIARPGDTINLLPGTYEPMVVSNKTDLLVHAPEGGVTLTSGTYEHSAGVLVEDSTGIVIDGLRTEGSLWGIRIFGSNRVIVSNNTVVDTGQEAIHVLNRSSDVLIEGNRIDTTGQRPGNNGEFEYADLGEGVYLGTGGRLPNGDFDDVSNVRIIGNDIGNTTAEAVEIKASVYDVVVRDNLIHDVDVHSGAAVSIGRGTRTYDANVIVENNAIWNVTTRMQWNDGIGIRVSSPAVVRANVIWNVQHFGIKIDIELRNEAGSVELADNLIFGAGLSPLANDGGETGVPITIEGTIEGDDATDVLGELGQAGTEIAPQVLIDYLNGL